MGGLNNSEVWILLTIADGSLSIFLISRLCSGHTEWIQVSPLYPHGCLPMGETWQLPASWQPELESHDKSQTSVQPYRTWSRRHVSYGGWESAWIGQLLSVWCRGNVLFVYEVCSSIHLLAVQHHSNGTWWSVEEGIGDFVWGTADGPSFSWEHCLPKQAGNGV